jgi:non-specific serine/threonine protein kinase
MSPAELLRRLEDRFRVLTGGTRTALPRHKTLRAAIDWSHELLSAQERILFRRLAVFAGRFDLDAAEEVCCGDALESEDVLDVLSQLVDKSLVMADGDDTVRYRLHETLRQYAGEKLDEAGERDSALDSHARFFIAVAEQMYAGRVDKVTSGTERLELEHGDLRAALDFLADRDVDRYLQLSGALGWFWHVRGHFREGRARLERAVAGRSDRTRDMARALTGWGRLIAYQKDSVRARTALEAGLSIWREIDDRVEIASSLEALGWTEFWAGDDDASLRRFEEGLAVSRGIGDPHLVNRAALNICQALMGLGDVDRAEPLAREALEVAREDQNSRDLHLALHFLADCALIRGDVDRAGEGYAKSLRAALDYGDIPEETFEVQGIAMALGGRGRSRKSLRLAGAASAAQQALGIDISDVKFWNELFDRWLGMARVELGSEAADAAWAEGRGMSFEDAVAYALDTERD